MPFYISPKTLKQQTKILVKHWPFKPIKNTHARNILCQLYGYKDNHQYRKYCEQPELVTIPISEEILLTSYKSWVKKLADLGSMNQIQSKMLLHKLWPAYLTDKVPLADKLYTAFIHFHGECRDFLNEELAMSAIEYAFDDRPSIKDTIEALGIPHTEIGAIQANGNWIEFDYLLKDGETFNVYSNPYLKAPITLPYKPEGELVFLLDVHLGALARYLRMAGFNCLHESKDYGDALLAEVAATGSYILLSRDIGLLKRSKVKYGRWIRHVIPEDQFKEVVKHYQLKADFKPFSRCVKCNGQIVAVDKECVINQVPEGVYEWQSEFQRCCSCHQVYWKGSHYEKIMRIIENV